MNPLFKGAIASAVSSASALILTLPAIDVQHFSPLTRTGLGHLGEAVIFVVLIGEARFWKQWADMVLGSAPPKP